MTGERISTRKMLAPGAHLDERLLDAAASVRHDVQVVTAGKTVTGRWYWVTYEETIAEPALEPVPAA